MHRLLFWMSEPYDHQVAQVDWERYVDSMSWMCFLLVLLALAVMLLGYEASARRRKIQRPADLFAPYTPLLWLLVAAPAGIAAGVIAAVSYEAHLGEQATGALPVGMQFAILTLAAALSFGYAAMLAPGITPAKFRYRPWKPFLQKR
jgi:hypothetical protein